MISCQILFLGSYLFIKKETVLVNDKLKSCFDCRSWLEKLRLSEERKAEEAKQLEV